MRKNVPPSFGTQGKETPRFAGLAVYIDPFEQVTKLPVSVYYPRKTCLLLTDEAVEGVFTPKPGTGAVSL